MLAGDLGPVARAALTAGDSALDAFVVRLMRPIQPMLAESEESVDAALDQLGDASVEYKLDGARIQVHKANDDVRIFSRTLRDVTEAAPEVVEIVRALPARELILDGEVIALRPDGRPQPFQVTMRRFGRTREVARSRSELPLTPFFFDCLYADGTVLLDEPQERRAGVLRSGRRGRGAACCGPRDAALAFAHGRSRRGHEGVMANRWPPPMPPAARRGRLRSSRHGRWISSSLAAEWGHGRRRGWLSNLHLGARDPEHHAFVMLGKTFRA